MKNILRAFPFHTLLICPAVIFFLYVHNYPDIYFNATYRSFIISILISGSVLTASYFFFRRNPHKAGFYATSFIMLLMSYGWIYDFLESLYYQGRFPFSHIHRYLAATLLLLFGVFYFFTTKKKKTFQSLTYPANLFVLFIFLLNAITLSFSAIRQSGSNKIIRETEPINAATLANDTLPDIYYIILDGYAQDSILSEVYDYNKNTLTKFLSTEGFVIPPNSRANYISTSPSLSSSLNCNYLDSIPANRESKTDLIYSNGVSKYLKQKGYSIVHVRSGYTVTRENELADTLIALENLNEFERTFLRYSFLRIDDVIGFADYRTLKEQLKVMYNVFSPKGPKFVFLHIVSPHPPYVCDEYGNFKTSSIIRDLWWEPKNDYLSQLKFINKEIINFISETFRQSKVKPVIIVQSDHGPWVKSNSFTTIYNSRSRILNAYYIPFSWKERVYPDITPVNSFRLIFNGLFSDSLPILKDIPMDSVSAKKNMNAALLEN